MTRPILVRADAQAELEEAAGWYERRRPGLGVEFVRAIEVALDAIAEAPESWPRWQPGYPYQKYVLRRFPFVVFFTGEGAGVQIVAFAQTKAPAQVLDATVEPVSGLAISTCSQPYGQMSRWQRAERGAC